ncbi:MAG: Ig-like domain repeat protein [Clostridiales bacterium]|nr:Ig-like domain repeat protein [Clostridiales bacterium]
MKKNFKRFLAFALAVLLLFSGSGLENAQLSVQAAQQQGGMPTENLDLLAEETAEETFTVNILPFDLSDGVGTGAASVTVTGTKTGEEPITVTQNISDNTGLFLSVPYQEGYIYRYQISFENYKDLTGTLEVTEAGKILYIHATLIPDYGVQDPSITNRTVQALDEATYSVVVKDAWATQVTWNVVNSTSSNPSAVINGAANGKECKVTAQESGTYVVTASLKGTDLSTTTVTVEKIPTILTVWGTEPTFWSSGVNVTASLKTKDGQPVTGKEVTISVWDKTGNNEVDRASVETDESGIAVKKFWLRKNGQYTLKAEYLGDNAYQAATQAEASYNPKRDEVTLDKIKVKATYGTENQYDLNLKGDNGKPIEGETVEGTPEKTSDVAKVSIKDGKFVVTPLKAGRDTLTLEFQTANYKFKKDFEITVKPYQLKLDPNSISVGASGSTQSEEFNGEKIYDGTSNVALKGALDKNSISQELAAELSGVDEIIIPEFDTFKTDVEDKNGKEAAQEFTAVFDLSQSTLSDDLKGKYTLKDDDGNNPSFEETITVCKRPLQLAIGNTEREFRSLKYKEKLENLISAEGYVDGEKEGVEKNKEFSFPTVIDTTLPEKEDFVIEKDDEAMGGPHVDALDFDKESGNPTKNYKFDFEISQKGTLTITAEDGGRKYLDIINPGESNGSTNVYQVYSKEETVEETIYYGNGITKDTTAVAKFSLSGKYDQVFLKDNIEITDGLNLDPAMTDGTIVEKEIYLANSTTKNKTKPFIVRFKYDKTVPECASIDLGTTSSVINTLVDAVTFGAYSNVSLTATVTLEDEISGIKTWSYNVMPLSQYNEIKAAATGTDDLTEALGSQTFTTPEDLDSRTIPVGKLKANESISDVQDNYIVFVRVEDYVGNAQIYGSNGIVLEDMHNISISYTVENPTGKDANGYQYHKENTVLGITATESGTLYSGIKKLKYTVTTVDGDVIDDTNPSENTYTVYQQEAGEENPESWVPQKTLEELQAYRTLNKNIDYKADEKVSTKVTVSASATDFAGNTMENAAETTFVVDGVKPEVVSSIKQEGNKGEFRNTKYANSDVIYTVTVTERYLNTNEVKVTINNKTYLLTELQSAANALGIEIIPGTVPEYDDLMDNTTYTLTIKFKKDGDYKVSTNVVDYAGNPGGDKEKEFTIDTKAPELTATYTAYYKDGTSRKFQSPLSSRIYANENVERIEVSAAITETNFALAGQSVNGGVIVTAKDLDKNDVIDEGAWDASFKENPLGDEGWKDGGSVSDTDTRMIHIKALPTINTDANYTFIYDYTDLAGNPLTTVKDQITLDRRRPHGTVYIDNMVNGSSALSWIDRLAGNITFGLFGQHTIGVSMDSSDVTSKVASTEYLSADADLKREQLASRTDWSPYHKKLTVSANQKLVVYEKVTDTAGNVEYYSSEGVIVDNTAEAPQITITPTAPAWGKGVYSAGDQPGFDFNVQDPVLNNSYAGLHEVTYRIVNGTTGATEENTTVFSKEEHKQSWSGHISIDPEKFYSNDVSVTVTANDWSTNEQTSETKTLKVDNKAPIVSFAFDRSDAQNGKYYKNNKTLTITVNERNFDPSYLPKVTSTAGGGYSFSGWSSNGETHTGTVSFSGDSDYTVVYDCYDLAGNKSNTETLEEFTVDKTVPVINVSYDNNSAQNTNYYKGTRTATVTITEHNFDSARTQISAGAVTGPNPSVSGWSSSGDRHTATVSFSQDGEYTLSVSGTDQAGNAAAEYGQDRFTVDLTKPEIQISGVEDKHAYNAVIAPAITVTDTNFSQNEVKVTLTGVKSGEVKTDSMLTVSNEANGRTYTFANFPEGMDDIYTLTVENTDKAGNENSQSVTFSVNRDGSAYAISNNTQKLIDKKYTNTPIDIELEEVNVNTLKFLEITYSRDGQVVTLKKGTDYTVEEEGGADQWKKYKYKISAACFEEEGTYVINIYSEDDAGNTTTNKVKAKTIEFTVDKTAPSIVVSNLVNKGRYQENKHQFTLNVKDNIALAYVELYLDGKLAHTYTGDELNAEDGAIYIDLDSKNSYQKVKLVAYDVAGNAMEDAYVSDMEGEEKTVFAEFDVLVTANALVQFYMNKPLFYGSIIGAVVLIAVIIILVKRRKDEKGGK